MRNSGLCSTISLANKSELAAVSVRIDEEWGLHSKFAIEMFVSVAQIKCLFTLRLSQEFKWGFLVNWRCGVGNNTEDDLAQEISNRLSKGIAQRTGPNKKLQSISKVCQAANGVTEIKKQFDLSGGIQKTSVQHTTQDSL